MFLSFALAAAERSGLELHFSAWVTLLKARMDELAQDATHEEAVKMVNGTSQDPVSFHSVVTQQNKIPEHMVAEVKAECIARFLATKFDNIPEASAEEKDPLQIL